MADIPLARTSSTQVATAESAIKFTPLALSVRELRSGRRIHQSETARSCANPVPVGDTVEANANSATMPPTETKNSQLRCPMLAPIWRNLAPEVQEAMKKEILQQSNTPMEWLTHDPNVYLQLLVDGLRQQKGREFCILEAGRVRELGKYFSSSSQPPSRTSSRLHQVEMKLEAMHQLDEEGH
ncbi:hypothetical protein D8674_024239 [Pyrus ussuriensis x Pyrus communis]|uniref:Uncharacterized protein n=1 Tax=Pyrus ussuriensis x Pyrus communis TaxID=2448454 RepID=A0A5N5H4D3_9ROSA|nr:hypothetical protein D8674_024239 [Pyrus ussuriensis x Pyrus communis]